MRKKERFVLGKRTFRSQKSKHFVLRIIMRFTPLARQKKLEFVIECSESIYASIDREALTKIISNLFTNAIKYSETYIHVRLWKIGRAHV